MSPNKFMKWNPKKKNHGKDGPGISLQPEWFPVYQRLFLRGFRFLSCLHHSVTREKSFFSRLRRSYLRPFGWHGRFLPHARKTSGYQNDNIFWWEEENLCPNKRRQDKINYKPINNSFKNKVHYYITQMRFYRGTQRQFSEYICSEDDLRSRIFGTFVVKFLACLLLQRFSNIWKMV